MRMFLILLTLFLILSLQAETWDLAEFTASDFLKLSFSQQIGWVQGYILGSWVVLKQLSVDGLYSELYSNFYVNLKDTDFHAYLIDMCRKYSERSKAVCVWLACESTARKILLAVESTAVKRSVACESTVEKSYA